MDKALRITCCLLLLATHLAAQSRFTGHVLPRVIKNVALKERLTWTLAVEPDLLWMQKQDGRMWQAIEPHIINIEQILDYQLSGDVNLSAGYFFGVRELNGPELNLEHRTLQQLTTTAQMGKYRMRLRVRSEQRFFSRENYRVIHRLRSRLSLDFPLQGERLDPGELFANATAEWLANPSQAQPMRFRESRIYAGLGWRFDSGPRFEHGIEWRSRLTDAEGHHRRALMLRLTLTL